MCCVMASVVWLHWCSSVAVERGERGPSQDTMLLRTIQGSLTRYKVFPCYTKLFPIIQICFSTRCDRHTIPEQTWCCTICSCVNVVSRRRLNFPCTLLFWFQEFACTFGIYLPVYLYGIRLFVFAVCFSVCRHVCDSSARLARE